MTRKAFKLRVQSMEEGELERMLDDIAWDIGEIEGQIDDPSRRPEGNDLQAQEAYREWRGRATRALTGKQGEQVFVQEELARRRGEPSPAKLEPSPVWKSTQDMTPVELDGEIANVKRQIQSIQDQMTARKRWAKRAQQGLDNRVRRLSRLKTRRRQLQLDTEQRKPRQTVDLFEKLVREVVAPMASAQGIDLTPEQHVLVREALERFEIVQGAEGEGEE